MAWKDNTNFRTPFHSNSYNPSDQFSAFMPGADLCKIQTEYFGWRILRAISIIPSDTSFTKTYYLGYERMNRKKLTRIAERKGDYNPVESWIYGGWWDCNGNESLGQLLRYQIPEASGYTPKEYHFTYNTNELFPRYIFASTDHWGYYNGYTEATTKGERSFSGIYLFDEDFYLSREPTSLLDIAKAEVLKEIKYPTGGKTCFEYKQNRYSKIVPENTDEELVQKTDNAGGLCISEISSYDENNNLVQTKRYYYADTIPPASDVGYNTSGILKAPKKYVMNYSFSDGYLSLCSEGGFLTTGTNRTDSHIAYSTVIEETIDGSGNSNGFVRYKYTNYDNDIWGENHRDAKYLYSNVSGDSYYNPSSSKSVERGKVMSEEYFNSDGKLIKSIKYKYTKTGKTPIKTLYQEKIIIPYGNGTDDYRYAYAAFLAPTYTYRYLTSNEIETNYNPITGQTMQVKEKSYTYNHNKLLESETIKNSRGNNSKIFYKYPYDFMESEPYTSMVNKNILTPVIEKTDYNENEWLQKEITDYTQWNNRFVPKVVKTQKKGQSNPEIRITYKDYIWNGNPFQVSIDGRIDYYIWAFNGQYLNAELKNMNENASFFIPEDDQFYEDEFNALREEFPNAQISSYTYNPTIGMTSSTTPNGVTTTYNYDSFGRLINIKDENEKTIENYEYHYKK
jgi:YD repeat-containing protein